MREAAEVRPATVTEEDVPLAPYTTLGVGGAARRMVTAATEAELRTAIRAADALGEPVLVLGGGSNLVLADEGFPGTVVRVATRGIRMHVDAACGGAVTVTVAAGEDWDRVVARCVAENMSGVECLSGIPGLAGATPIQNVGAYGQEVADVLTGVRVFDRRSAEVIEMPNSRCGFGYRTSVFKRAATGRFVVLEVTFRLARDPLSRPVRYRGLATTLGVGIGDRVPLADARHAVLALRSGKGMVLDPMDPDTRSAGSFFTNPILPEAQFAALLRTARTRFGPATEVPNFPDADGAVKVPAAWLIERAGFGRGHHGDGGARISTKHTLALVNPGGATTADLVALARAIRDGVRTAFGVDLVAEPVLVGVSL